MVWKQDLFLPGRRAGLGWVESPVLGALWSRDGSILTLQAVVTETRMRAEGLKQGLS